jgi:hypothetical protein
MEADGLSKPLQSSYKDELNSQTTGTR